jgi:hypothetical protein
VRCPQAPFQLQIREARCIVDAIRGTVMTTPRPANTHLRLAILLFFGLGSLLILPGCWVFSVNPLYDESIRPTDPDLRFDKKLVGTWDHLDDGCHWILTVAGNEKAYHLTMAPGVGCGKTEKTTKYEGHLVRIDQYYFLDVSPNPDDVCELCLEVHSFMLFTMQDSKLSLTPFNQAWLAFAIKDKKVDVPHLGGGGEYNAITLTANSTELKDLLRRHADDKDAFKADDNLLFTRQ